MANESLTVWIDDEKLSCFDKQMLCDKVFARTGKTEKDKSTWTCRDFWKERENIPEEAMEYIHWEALKKALANSPQGTQRWILKHSTGQCRVGRMLYKDGIIKNIVCAQDVENKTKQPRKHVIQCRAVDTRQRWKTGTKAIWQWFITTSTNPNLQHTIFQRLEEWCDNKPWWPIHTSNRMLRKAVQQQDLIGWQSFLQGRVT